jgi:hypothetical protein
VHVIGCGAAVVAAMQIERRQLRHRQPVLVQLGILRRGLAVPDRGAVIPERSPPPLRRADGGVDMAQVFGGAVSGRAR